MAVPKKRHSKSKVGRRRMHYHLKETETAKCKQCGVSKLPHRICPACGYYKGKKVIEVEREKKKKEKS